MNLEPLAPLFVRIEAYMERFEDDAGTGSCVPKDKVVDSLCC